MDEHTVAGNHPASQKANGAIYLEKVSADHQLIELIQQRKKLIDTLVLILGGLVSLIGFLNVLAHLFSWPQLSGLPDNTLHWMSYPISWAMSLLGIGMMITLQGGSYNFLLSQKSRWLRPVRCFFLGAPGVIGLYYLLQYLSATQSTIGEILLSVHPRLASPFFSSLYTLFCSMVLFGLCAFNRRQWYCTYVVGVFSLYLISLCSFIGFGHLLQLPAMFGFNMSFFTAFCFILIGVAMLIGTLPDGGLLLPVFSRFLKIKILSFLALLSGLLVLTLNVITIDQINRRVNLLNFTKPTDMLLYALLEILAITDSVVIIVLFLRALTYYNASIAYGVAQQRLFRTEKTIRQVMQVIHNSLNLEEIFQGICNELGAQLQVDRCFISQCSDNKFFPPRREYRSAETVPSMLELDIQLWNRLNRFSSLLCLSGSPLEFDSEQISPDMGAFVVEVHQLMREINLVSGLGCAVNYHGECKAVLFLHQTSGKRIWTEEEKSIVQVVSAQIGVAICLADLYRKLQESEQRFRLLVEGTQEYAIYMLDPHGLICTWNEGLERMSGYTADEVMGHHFSMFFKDHEVPSWYFEHVLDVAGKVGFYKEESIRYRKDGTLLWFSVLTCALHDESGTLVGYSRILQDITEFKRVEQELKDAKQAAELANTRKTKVLTAMSHEFKTSLNAIIGYADMLTQGKANTQEREERYTKNIADSGRHLLTVVNDILDIAQAESGKIRLNPQWIDPGQLLLDLEPMIQPMADELNVQLSFALEPNTPQVYWDPARMKQAFLNLLSNAVKYNHDHGTVTVRMAVSENRDELMIQVQDTGYGIPADKLEDIFTEFFRLNGDTQSQSGTGLGLALARQFVELHGGRITAESVVGVGSIFTVRIPIKRVVASSEAEASSKIGSA